MPRKWRPAVVCIGRGESLRAQGGIIEGPGGIIEGHLHINAEVKEVATSSNVCWQVGSLRVTSA